MKNKKNVYESLVTLIQARLENNFVNQHESRELYMKIYVSIFNTIVEVFESIELRPSEEVINWIAQAFYKNIKMNGYHSPPLDIYTKRVELQDLTLPDMFLLITIFRESNTSIEDDVYKEHCRRTGIIAN